MKGEEYTCEGCKGVFLKTCSDEEMMKELESVMPEAKNDDTAVVCDDCWLDFMGWLADATLEQRMKMRERYLMEKNNERRYI